jgi:methylated-DNA-protein-cysteine methyltransferase-like protein
MYMKDYFEPKEDFFEKVFAVVALIPFGRVTTYGAIAEYLGAKKSARLVGYAMNASHALPNKIPAHRVVNRNGLLTGKMHFSYPTQMEELLQIEGIKVENNQIIDFKNKLWLPIEEL